MTWIQGPWGTSQEDQEMGSEAWLGITGCLQVHSGDEILTVKGRPLSRGQGWRQVNLQHSCGRCMAYYVNCFLCLTVGLTKLFHTEHLKKKKKKSRNPSVCKGKCWKVKTFWSLCTLFSLSVSTLSILARQCLPEIPCTTEVYLSWKHHSNTKQYPQDQKGNTLHKKKCFNLK